MSWTRKRYCTVSLDCDTAEDAPAAVELANWLVNKGIRASLAVPGMRLEAGAKYYEKIAQLGLEFMNHGFNEHAQKIAGRYVSVNSYPQLTHEQIATDIKLGHNAVIKISNSTPTGWRTPHFGTLHDPVRVATIYKELKKMDYRYSSSSVARTGIKRGGKYKAWEGITEFPLSGGFDYPFLTLDSWTFFAAPNRTYSPGDYYSQVTRLAGFWSRNRLPGLLNLYVDPSHVLNKPEFRKAIEYILDLGFKPVSYRDLV